MIILNVNGERREVQAPGDTQLLYVLRNELSLLALSLVVDLRSAARVPSWWTARRRVPALRRYRSYIAAHK